MGQESKTIDFDVIQIIYENNYEVKFLIEESMIEKDENFTKYWLRPIFGSNEKREDLDQYCQVSVDGKSYNLSAVVIPYDLNFHRTFVLRGCRYFFLQRHARVKNYQTHISRLSYTRATNYYTGAGFLKFNSNNTYLNYFMDREIAFSPSIRILFSGDIFSYIFFPETNIFYQTTKKFRYLKHDDDNLKIINANYIENKSFKKQNVKMFKSFASIYYYESGDEKIYLQSSNFNSVRGRYFSVLGKYASDNDLIRANPDQRFGFYFYEYRRAIGLGLLQQSPIKLDPRQNNEPLRRTRVLQAGDVAMCMILGADAPVPQTEFLTPETSKICLSVGESIYCLQFFANTNWSPSNSFESAADIEWASSLGYDKSAWLNYARSASGWKPKLRSGINISPAHLAPSPDPRFARNL